MIKKTITLLEFDQIRQRVADYCLNDEAAAVLRTTPVSNDPVEIAELKALVALLTARLTSSSVEPNLVFPNISGVLAILGKEAVVLELEAAYALGLYTESASRFKAWLGAAAEAYSGAVSNAGAGRGVEALRRLVAELPDCSPVTKAVFAVLDHDGALRDLAVFRAIKRRLASLRREIEATAKSYLADEAIRRLLQSDVATQRDGRLVLALKANYRGRLKGIVHEVSASGQTLFIEPDELVEKNNQLLIEERCLAAEITKVLRQLTASLGQWRDELVVLREKIIFLDGLRARARYGNATNGIPALNPATASEAHLGPLELRQARHPLLGTAAVPIDIVMDATTRVVIITGPNTGGKTVALKTVGLFALMNQFGLALPAAEGSLLPWFDGIYADIGDEQSISQSLSTFSAHMTNIAQIISAASQKSLVLLDELGSGTDPEEGSAIAMALLDHFIELGSRVLITSHHGILKNFGYSKAGVVNASVDFDLRTLSPTFRLVMGIPGESRALDIAARNGLAKDLIERARAYIDEERTDISALIRGLKAKHGELAAAERAWQKQQQLLCDDRRRVDLKELRLKQRELELRDQGLGELRRYLTDSRKTLENLVRELREGELSRDKTLKVKKFLNDLNARVQAEALRTETEVLAASHLEANYQAQYPELEKKAKQRRSSKKDQLAAGLADPNNPPLIIAPGVEVLVGQAARRGRVLRAAKKGCWLVEVGALRLSLAEHQLKPVPALRSKPPVEINAASLADDSKVVLELNLIGYRHDEALEALQRQLDGAVMSGLYQFSVIHGKGDGILRQAVHDYLKNQLAVAEFSFARADDGGFGKTIVNLKR